MTFRLNVGDLNFICTCKKRKREFMQFPPSPNLCVVKMRNSPHNKMPSLIPIGVLVENEVKFHDHSMDVFHKNTIKMNQNF